MIMTGKAKLEFEKFILERNAYGAENVFVNKHETSTLLKQIIIVWLLVWENHY